jgi:isoleucyl-tRNA synthetase
MPYAQDHYPFENREAFEKKFPADFIGEGLDQTRGWFYTLTVLAAALFERPAFRNCIVNGIILAEDGQKMSKRLKNYPEPSVVIDRFGADAIRLYLLSSPAVYGEDMRFSEKGVELVLRQVLIPFWNSLVFLSTYAKIYRWKPSSGKFSPPSAEIDRWILSRLQKLVLDVTAGLDSYQLHRAVEPFVSFIDQLTNWYIRRNRSRFWAEEGSRGRDEAFETLYTVLLTLSKIAAPFVPFLSEAIYLQLKTEGAPASVHLCDFPLYLENLRAMALEMEMEHVQEVVSLGHGLRKEHKLKVRQPLLKAYIISADGAILEALKAKQNLIADELNVKEVEFTSEEEDFVTLLAKPNFRVLGKKVGKLMNAVQAAVTTLPRFQLARLLTGAHIEMKVGEETIVLTPEDIGVERKVKEGLVAATTNGITIALETTLSDALLLEGLAREIVNKINTMRRDGGFLVTDRIVVSLQATERLKKCFDLHRDYIMHEVLATHVHFACQEGTDWDLNGEMTRISLALSVI